MSNPVYSTSYSLYNPLISGPYSAFMPVKGSDFGQLQPGSNSTTNDGGWSASNLAYNAGAGNLALTTAHAKITYVTAQGESLPSADATVSIAAGSGAFTITFPTVPNATASSPLALAAPVIGFRVYSASSTATLLNTGTDFDSTTQALLVSVVTTSGTISNVIPVATATVQVQTYGTGAVVPVVNLSGIRLALPTITTNATKDYFLTVKRNFRAQKHTEFTLPNSNTSEPAGFSIVGVDCIAPIWQASTAINAAFGSSQAASSYLVLNGTVFYCSTAGTTGSTVPTFSFTPNATTTDNTATWTCLGPAEVVRFRFSNLSGGTITPISQDMWIHQI